MLTQVLCCGVCTKDIASTGAVELLLPSDTEPIIDVFMENCSSSCASKLPVETAVTKLQVSSGSTPSMVKSHPLPSVVTP